MKTLNFTPSERQAQLLDWLLAARGRYRLDLSSLKPMAADAGFRRYFRIRSDDASLVVMDAPPPSKTREFARIASLLAQAGVHVPRLLASDFERGFMLITDLGRTAYLDSLRCACRAHRLQDAQALFRDALAALIRWQRATRPHTLPVYSAALLRAELELFPSWYIRRHLGQTLDTSRAVLLEQIFETLIAHALSQPPVFVHLDYMPRNLIVCADNPGVIDFQDARYGPITYDLVSLFRDAFISWDAAFERDCLLWYWHRAKRELPLWADFAQFYRHFEWMGLQRHLKVLGIFARLNYRDGKPDYLKDSPRFLGYIRQVAQRYRALAPLARFLDSLPGNAQAGSGTGE